MNESSGGKQEKVFNRSEMECRFSEVAKSASNSHASEFPKVACPDKIWGELKCSDRESPCKKYDLPLEIPNSSDAADAPRVIMVLESPHMSEFENQKKPIGPAQGVTGDRIRARLAGVLNKHINPKTCYQIVVINAIQYQCSRGELNSYNSAKKRDEIFRDFWYDHGRKDFICRLKFSVQANDILINACTKGKTRGAVTKDTLKPNGWLYELVDTAIKDSHDGHRPTLLTYHPCSWNRYSDAKKLHRSQ